MIERSRRRHINIQMILRVMGWLLMIEAAFMLVPLVTGLIYDEMKDVKVFGLTSVITFGCGVLLTFGLHPRDTRMGRHEGFLLTTLIWILFSAFGMIPFMLCDRPVSLTNAFSRRCRVSPPPAAPSFHQSTHILIQSKCGAD